MILKVVCRNPELIENYELAKADNFKGWVIHHRLETISTGAVVTSTRQDLIDWGIYYDRPADELIYLTRAEHNKIHAAEIPEETRKRISNSLKGKNTWTKGNQTWWLGRHHTEEAKLKISKASTGRKHSIESRLKVSKALKGRKNTWIIGSHWKLVDGKRVYYRDNTEDN